MINIYFSDIEAVEACICRLNVLWYDVYYGYKNSLMYF